MEGDDGINCRRTRINRPFSILEGSSAVDFSFSLLLLEVSLILVLSHILRFLLKPLRQPKVVSDVLVSSLISFHLCKLPTNFIIVFFFPFCLE